MSWALTFFTMLHTFFVIALMMVLIPLRLPERRYRMMPIGVMAALFIAAGLLALYCGMDFLASYGYLLIGLPLGLTMYWFSTAKGSRYLFVVLTILIFYRIISTLLAVARVYTGGFTPLYFFLNFLLFGALLLGGQRMRADFHKIVFSYQKEFGYLSMLLALLLILLWLFSPIIDCRQVDGDVLLVTALLDLLTLLFYIYIGISFRSFSRRLDAERNALSLEHQMRTAREYIRLIRTTQEKAMLYRHDLRGHLRQIGAFLDDGNLMGLRHYLAQTQQALDARIPTLYCANEAANLIFAPFVAQAQTLGIRLEIDAQIPGRLSIDDTMLCTLLSNALENAVTATARVMDGREKAIRLSAGMSDDKLMILVENPYIDIVRIENGLPQCEGEGQGFGTKNIEAIVESHGGLSSFEAQDGIFTVRLVV